MNLIWNWRDVLTKAWSVRFIIAAGVLSGLEVILPFFADEIPRRPFAAASFCLTMAAVVARIWAQPKLNE